MARKSEAKGGRLKILKIYLLHRYSAKFVFAVFLLAFSSILLLTAFFYPAFSSFDSPVFAGRHLRLEDDTTGSARVLSGSVAGENQLLSGLDEQQQNNELMWVRLVRTLMVYLAILAIILGSRYMYEGMRESFFIGVISILAVVLLSGEIIIATLSYFFKEYPRLLQRLCLLGSMISFGSAICLLIGFYPMSSRILIKAIRRQLVYREIGHSDWVQDGNKALPLVVVPMNFIPKSTAQLSDSRSLSIQDALMRFFQGSQKRAKQNLILVGGFGSGKSTALCQAVQQWLTFDFLHSAEIPVYIKLCDWLDDQDLILIKESIIERHKNGDYRNRQASYMERICHLIKGQGSNRNENNNRHEDFLLNILVTLHEERRLVYIFDGFNELLQGIKLDYEAENEANEQYARNLAAFLQDFASGNRYIVSTSELPGVITDRSMLVGRAGELSVIYAVKGIELSRQQSQELKTSEGRWKKKLLPNVALYRLADSMTARIPDTTTATASTDLKKEKKRYTTYQLLLQYVEKQIAREVISETKVKEYCNALRAIMNQYLENLDSTLICNPYTGYDFSKIDLSNIPNIVLNQLFYKNPDDPKTYHASNILLNQFLLAQFIVKKFFISESSVVNSFNMNIEKDSFKALFGGDANNPCVLKHPHLNAAFRMAVTTAFVEMADNWSELEDLCEKYFLDFIAFLKEDKVKSFLVQISQINDDIHAVIDKRPRYSMMNECIQEELKKLNNAKKDSDIPARFALIKLLSNGQKKEQLKELLSESIKKPWTFLSIQREILDNLAEKSVT